MSTPIELLKQQKAIRDQWAAQHGATPQEVTKAQEPTVEEWKAIRQDYNKYRKDREVIPTWLLLILLLGTGYLAYWSSSHKGWLWAVAGWCAVMTAYYSLRALCVREAHWSIYEDGFSSGYLAGVNKTLGISEEEDKFIHRMAMDEEIYGPILDKHKEP